MRATAGRSPLVAPFAFLAVSGLLLAPGCQEQLPHIEGNEVTITAENFEAKVLESDKPVLIDFWASWCGPCRQLEPVVAHLSVNYEGRLVVGKVNVDEQQELAGEFNVSSIPHLALFHNGELVASQSGYLSLSDLSDWVDGNVPIAAATADSGR